MIAAQPALSDLGSLATKTLKLGLADRRAKLQQHEAKLVEAALLMALEATRVPHDKRKQARQVLIRQLAIVAADGASA